MKLFSLLACSIAALSLSVLAAFFALGRLTEAEPVEHAEEILSGQSVSLHPEQSRKVESLLREILARQAELERKEQSLEEQGAVLLQEQIVLERLREELESARRDVEERFTKWDEEERANTRKVAEFVSNMDAERAARLLSEMEVPQAARILAQQGDRKAGAIMDEAVEMGEVGMERALSWSDAIQRMRNEGL